MKTPKLAIAAALLAGACTKSPSSEPTPKAETTGSETVKNEELTLEQATAGLGEGKLRAEIETDLGKIDCELFPDKAPKTVASFVGLARGLRAYQDPNSRQWVKGPFFDGLTFHRVIPDFMIQGGDPLSRGAGSGTVGTGGPGYSLPDELAPDLKFDRPGRLAMANSGPRTGSGGSQFFITEVPYPSLDGGYVIFGQCEGLDVVKKIARVPKKRGDEPAEPVRMKVEITKK